MATFDSIPLVLTSGDPKIRRQINYWIATFALYTLCVGLLWTEVWLGNVRVEPARWLTVCIYGGVVLFYVLIRSSDRLQMTPQRLAILQGNFAIVCIAASYAISGPMRGATLTLLVVVLVFCAFTLDPKRFHVMSIFAILLLGTTMTGMVLSDPIRFRPARELAHFMLAASMLLAVGYVTAELSRMRTRLTAQKEELTEALSRIQTLATRDELTSLANRRYMSEILAQEERRYNAEGKPVCIALIDIDLFKQINDTFGHAAGDEVLRTFAQQAQAVLRTDDVLARWGGEEFLLLLPDTDLWSAKMVLERIRQQIASLDFSAVVPGRRISFSAGLIALTAGEAVSDGVRRADHAMYAAKSAGRDCVVVG